MDDGLESVFTAHEILGLAGLFKDRLLWSNYNDPSIANKGQTKMPQQIHKE